MWAYNHISSWIVLHSSKKKWRIQCKTKDAFTDIITHLCLLCTFKQWHSEAVSSSSPSTPQVTWTSPSRWSERCVCWTVPCWFCVRWEASSVRPWRWTGRWNATTSPSSPSSTSWIAWAPTLTGHCSSSGERPLLPHFTSCVLISCDSPQWNISDFFFCPQSQTEPQRSLCEHPHGPGEQHAWHHRPGPGAEHLLWRAIWVRIIHSSLSRFLPVCFYLCFDWQLGEM